MLVLALVLGGVRPSRMGLNAVEVDGGFWWYGENCGGRDRILVLAWRGKYVFEFVLGRDW